MNPFTQQQKDGICNIIGDWYTFWKWSLFDGHNNYLDPAVFMLKNFMFYCSTYYRFSLDLDEEQKEHVELSIKLWQLSFAPKTKDGGKTHNFGLSKEILKLMICGD